MIIIKSTNNDKLNKMTARNTDGQELLEPKLYLLPGGKCAGIIKAEISSISTWKQETANEPNSLTNIYRIVPYMQEPVQLKTARLRTKKQVSVALHISCAAADLQ